MMEIRTMNATRSISLGVVMVGVLIGSGRASEAGFMTYSLSGYEAVGFETNMGIVPTAFDFVSISMTVDTSTIINDPTHSNFSPGYTTGTALATINVFDATLGELTMTLMAHVGVFQTFAVPGPISGYFTELQFFADSGPSLGNAIGVSYFLELVGTPPYPTGFPLPVTYDLKSPIDLNSGYGIISSNFQTSEGTLELGVTRPDNPFKYFSLNFQATVPELSSLALCGIAGIVGLVVVGVRRRFLG